MVEDGDTALDETIDEISSTAPDMAAPKEDSTACATF